MCKKKKTLKQCGNNALDGYDYCRMHNVTSDSAESENEMVAGNEVVAPPINLDDLTLMFNSILTSLSELKITVETKKKQKEIPLLKRAKMAFYHDIKKDIKFKEYVAGLHNLQVGKIPWQLVKEKSDLYWVTVEQSVRDKYIAHASTI